MTTVVKSKLVAKDLGNPQKLVAGDESAPGPARWLGNIFGLADHYQSKDFNGETFHPIIGSFEGVRSEPASDGTTAVKSGVLYLPGGLHEQLMTALSAENRVGPIQVMMRVCVRKAANPIGYEYVTELVEQPDEADPLAELRQRMLAHKPTLAIADQSKKKAA